MLLQQRLVTWTWSAPAWVPPFAQPGLPAERFVALRSGSRRIGNATMAC